MTRTIWTVPAALGVAVLLAACGQEAADTSAGEPGHRQGGMVATLTVVD
jgi:hypothetical protein